MIAVGVALATPGSGVTPGPFHARGSAVRLRINDESMRLSLKAKSPTDVQVVSATLAQGGFTGWHTHAGPSVAIVKTGQITIYTPSRRGDDDDDDDDGPPLAWSRLRDHGSQRRDGVCAPKGVHNFVNTAAGPTEFYIVYFLAPGRSPAPDNTPPAPAGCPA